MMSQLAFAFPGQGSQSVCMLKELSEQFDTIQETFAEASHGADIDLWQISQENPDDKLNQTEFTQPALLAANIALWRLWQQQAGAQPSVLLGHSLGEYAALVASNALSLHDAAKLVRLRGQYMQAAVPVGVGAMAAVLGADYAVVTQTCTQCSTNESIVVPANYNSPGQIVIGGHLQAVDRAIESLQTQGIRKIVKLPVSVPSHTPLMREAAERLGLAIEAIQWQMPDRTIIHNVDAKSKDSVEAIQQALMAQLYLPVQWTQCTQALAAQGVLHVVECGPGKVLSGLIKRIDKSITTYTLSSPLEWQATYNQTFV